MELLTTKLVKMVYYNRKLYWNLPFYKFPQYDNKPAAIFDTILD